MVALLVAVIALATAGKSIEAATGFALMLAVILSQALLLRCHRCGARPGLWILAIWTLLLDYELYLADALLLRQCP